MKKAVTIISIVALLTCCQHLMAANLPPLFINPDQTVTDISTGLMWYQEITPSHLDWASAQAYCESLTSYTDWRLPSVQELKDLAGKTNVDKSYTENNAIFFPNTQKILWTSTSTPNSLSIITVDLSTGLTSTKSPMDELYFRAVRDANHQPSFIQIPMQGGVYKIGSQISIAWGNNVYTKTTVDIEISYQGGRPGTYETILSSADRSPYNWIVSRPASPNCQIRIIINDNSLTDKIHTVGHFAIVDNNAPEISPIFPRSTLPGRHSDSISFNVNNTDGGGVMIIANSDNLSVVPRENIHMGSNLPAYCTVIPSNQLSEWHYFTIEPGSVGKATITLNAYDSGLLIGQQAFEFIVGTQKDSLIHLYEQTSGPGWDRNALWNSNEPVCNWEGITCNNDLITGIQLSNNRLSGSIPFDIGNLGDLVHLDLSHNYLYGEIPENMYLLNNLKELDLSYNHLSKTIPSELMELEQMEQLYLNDNHLEGAVPATIFRMSKLTHLNISRNKLSGGFPDGILSLSHLVQLDLSYNHFDGEIPENLKYLDQLQSLSIASNQFASNMPESIQDLTNLKASDSDFRYNMLTAPNSDVADFMAEKQISNNWQSTQTLPPSNFQTITATNNMISFSWEPLEYTADGGYEICCSRNDGTSKCDTMNSKALTSFELWGVLPNTSYDCKIRTITLPNIMNANRLVSAFSKGTTAQTQIAEEIWNVMESPTHEWLNDVWGMDKSKHYIVGESGTILIYNDSQWIPMTSTNTESLHSVFGFSETDVVAVGADGTILQFNGDEWKIQTPVVDTFLWGLWGVDNTYYAVGASGTILQGENGHWEPMNIPTGTDFRDIWGSSKNDIFVVGNQSTIFHYNGSTWSEMAGTYTQTDLRCIWGFSPENVYAGGVNGTVLHYDGNNWHAMNSGVDSHLMAMWGSSENSLFAVGSNGTIISFDGSAWQKIYSGTKNDLRGMWGSSERFTVGYDGTILRFATQLPTITEIASPQRTNVNHFHDVWFEVSSTMVSPERLNVVARSSDPTLIPGDYQHLKIHGTGTDRQLVITPARDQSGESEIIVTVSTPDGLTASTQFTINVSSDPLIPHSERDALLALFEQTNGYQWTIKTGWGESWGTECNWYGITCVNNHTNIGEIILPENALSGPLPSTLANLTHLTTLDFHGNILIGELPKSFGGLHNLIFLDLSNNAIEGQLPSEWGNLNKLLILKLAHNHLSGSIPSTFGNMGYLQFMELNSNCLAGSIPKTLTKLYMTNENQSNFHYNALYSNDYPVIQFMSKLQSDWDAYQTTAPENIHSYTDAYIISLEWEKSDQPVEIFYSDSPSGSFAVIGPIWDHSVNITGLRPQTTYYLKIRKIRGPHANNRNTVYSDFAEITAATGKTDQTVLWGNGSFERGDFEPWDIKDVSQSSIQLQVIEYQDLTGTAFANFFNITPSHGRFVAAHGNISGQGTVQLSQDIYIPAGGGIVVFDYRLGWDMSANATLDRSLNVTITPEGSYTPAENHHIISASPGTQQPDTGWTTHTLDVSAYACQTVRISFNLTYPENAQSPMLFLLDNVELTANFTNILEIRLPEVTEGDAILADAGLILLPEALNQDLSIKLKSSQSLMRMPALVTIPKGDKQANFNIVIGDDTEINGLRQAIISVDDPHWAACNKQISISDNDDVWQTIENVGIQSDITCIWGRSATHIFVLSGNKVIQYNGIAWEPETLTSINLNAIWGDANQLYVVGNQGIIFSYENNAWQIMNTPVDTDLTAIWGNSDSVFAAGPDGTLLKKSDNEWILDNTFNSGSMPVKLCGYDQVIYMISDAGIHEYSNDNWIPLTISGMQHPSDIYGTGNQLVMVGEQGNIIFQKKSTWKTAQTNTQSHLNAVTGKKDILYAVGHDGTILRSQSPDNWIQMNTKTQKILNDVWAASENNVYAVGDNGTVLRYSGPDILGGHSASGFVPGELLTVQNVISFPAHINAITLNVRIPDGWTFKDTEGLCQIEYENHVLKLTWSTNLKSPIIFNYRLNVPKYPANQIALLAKLTYSIEGNEKMEKKNVAITTESGKEHPET
ncbi:MAG: hypothetical protein OMM_01685 [Candidatus Magnetoglobus multicellularis str. Araruama]|uniref:Fibronectin type-III domain-containing protein n=1 Tax=Candidatus Magnetoglobus multicellularis str. Araruama TaxID=890399 RepID=A0A1V1PCA7_9BACT|nr:MAG: hypothetical protein OMM_01685 [Candidatus Magnetoglobus multicellularis str. Araruama]